MTAATVRASCYTGATPTSASCDSQVVNSVAAGSIVFNTDTSQTGTSAPITRPTTTGTNFSFHKVLGLDVVVVSATPTTTMSFRKISLSAALQTGLTLGFKGSATYTQSATLTASGSNGAVPTGYTATTTSAQGWDVTNAGTGNPIGTGSTSAPCGDYVFVALGVDATYAGGAGAGVGLGTGGAAVNLVLQYNEA